MSEVLQANIFFFITSIAVIVFTILLCVALYHFIKILKAIRKIVERIDRESEQIAEDMSHMRNLLFEGSLISYIIGTFLGRKPKKKTASRFAKKRSGTMLKITEEE